MAHAQAQVHAQAYAFDTLRVRVEDGVARVTFDNPPINLATLKMGAELARFIDQVAEDDTVRVIVFDSADPDFFIAHVDMSDPDADWPEDPPFWAVLEQLSRLPKASIAKIAGRTRGVGSEIVLACDMRFASAERAVFCQPEVAVGMVLGAGGTQRLPALAGRARALEILLGAEDFDAALAERYGWINRALPDAELDAFVDRLARRIASFPPEAVAAAKAMVDPITLPDSAGLAEEWRQTKLALARPQTQERLRRLLELGTQTRGPAELDHASFLDKL